MGLTSLWSNITGPKVKEITPQPQCSWLEKNRPKTSGSARTKKVSHLQLTPSGFGDTRPTTSADGKRKKRSLSISRPKLLEQSKKDRDGTGVRGSGKVPDVPALPPALSPGYNVPSEDRSRPATALTTDGSVATTEIFELAGDGLPSPRFQTPLPSPMSPTYPSSPRSYMTATSQEPTNMLDENDGGLRKRSNSTASGKPKLKRASWFMGSKKAAEAELPPPLPPPSGPPPEPPVIQAMFKATQVSETRPPSPCRNSSADVANEAPLSAAPKSSLDSDSILNAFPSVPAVLVSNTVEAHARTSAAASANVKASQPTPTGDGSANERESPSPSSPTKKRPRPIAVPTQTIDGLLLAPDTPRQTPKHDSKQLPPLPPEAFAEQNKADSKALSFSEELQQEYDRMMEVMGEQPNPGVVMSIVGNSDGRTQNIDTVQKFSNDEALAKLEFGILK